MSAAGEAKTRRADDARVCAADSRFVTIWLTVQGGRQV